MGERRCRTQVLACIHPVNQEKSLVIFFIQITWPWCRGKKFPFYISERLRDKPILFFLVDQACRGPQGQLFFIFLGVCGGDTESGEQPTTLVGVSPWERWNLVVYHTPRSPGQNCPEACSSNLQFSHPQVSRPSCLRQVPIPSVKPRAPLVLSSSPSGPEWAGCHYSSSL